VGSVSLASRSAVLAWNATPCLAVEKGANVEVVRGLKEAWSIPTTHGSSPAPEQALIASRPGPSSVRPPSRATGVPHGRTSRVSSGQPQSLHRGRGALALAWTSVLNVDAARPSSFCHQSVSIWTARHLAKHHEAAGPPALDPRWGSVAAGASMSCVRVGGTGMACKRSRVQIPQLHQARHRVSPAQRQWIRYTGLARRLTAKRRLSAIPAE
jgi:hypothetical protein